MIPLKLESSTVTDRIRLHYIEGKTLNAEDEKIRLRLDAAHSLKLADFESDKNAAAILMRKFGISQTQAYRDLLNAKNIFGNVQQATKEAIRVMITEWATIAMKMAHQAKDLKNMNKAMENIIRANNLDKDDVDIPDASKIQPPVQLLQVNFNFIDSPMFKLIDKTTQKAILLQYDLFMEQVKLSPMADFTDMWKIDESAREES